MIRRNIKIYVNKEKIKTICWTMLYRYSYDSGLSVNDVIPFTAEPELTRMRVNWNHLAGLRVGFWIYPLFGVYGSVIFSMLDSRYLSRPPPQRRTSCMDGAWSLGVPTWLCCRLMIWNRRCKTKLALEIRKTLPFAVFAQYFQCMIIEIFPIGI
jgi:hypothetical protein